MNNVSRCTFDTALYSPDGDASWSTSGIAVCTQYVLFQDLDRNFVGCGRRPTRLKKRSVSANISLVVLCEIHF
jgi:hypothetical protein